MLGWSAAEAVGRNAVELLLPAEKREGYTGIIGRLRELLEASGLEVFFSEQEVVRRDGVRIPVEIAMSNPVHHGGGDPYVVFVRDISERRRDERDLRQSAARLDSALASAPLAIITLDRDLRFTFARGRALASIGLDGSKLLGTSAIALTQNHAEIEGMLRRALAGGEFEEHREYAGHHLHLRFAPVRSDSGEISGVAIVGIDITQKHEADERAAARSRHLAAALQIAGEALRGSPVAELMQHAAEAAATALEADMGAVRELAPDGRSVRAVADVGYRQPGGAYAVTPDSLVDRLRDGGAPVAVSDYVAEKIACPPHLRDEGVQATLAASIGDEEGWFGILALHSRTPRIWTEDEVGFVQLMGNLLWVAVDRQRAEAERRLLMARLVDATEQERRRIAADVHDDAVQVMTAVTMRLHLLRQHLVNPNQLEVARSLESTVSLAIERLRRLLFELTPPALERHGLAAALRITVDEFERDHGTRVVISSTLESDPGLTADLVIYRIVQEALANVRKHADAKRVEIVLGEATEGVVTEVKDDGCGFDSVSADEREHGHIGLIAMRERAELAGGWCSIDSKIGTGTSVKFLVPRAGPPPDVETLT